MRIKTELYEIQFKYKALKAKVEKSRKETEGLKVKLKKSYMAQKNVTLEHQEIKTNLDRMSKVQATIHGVLNQALHQEGVNKNIKMLLSFALELTNLKYDGETRQIVK